MTKFELVCNGYEPMFTEWDSVKNNCDLDVPLHLLQNVLIHIYTIMCGGGGFFIFISKIWAHPFRRLANCEVGYPLDMF